MSDKPKFTVIDIDVDREKFLKETAPEFIHSLSADSLPLWGMMRGQHVVEHLTYITGNIIGEHEVELLIPPDHLPKYKGFLMSTYGFNKNFKFPLIPQNETLPLQFNSMKDACAAYKLKMGHFFELINREDFESAPHPFYGDMTREESIMFQYKHHLHHMTQFGYE